MLLSIEYFGPMPFWGDSYILPFLQILSQLDSFAFGSFFSNSWNSFLFKRNPSIHIPGDTPPARCVYETRLLISQREFWIRRVSEPRRCAMCCGRACHHRRRGSWLPRDHPRGVETPRSRSTNSSNRNKAGERINARCHRTPSVVVNSFLASPPLRWQTNRNTASGLKTNKQTNKQKQIDSNWSEAWFGFGFAKAWIGRIFGVRRLSCGRYVLSPAEEPSATLALFILLSSLCVAASRSGLSKEQLSKEQRQQKKKKRRADPVGAARPSPKRRIGVKTRQDPINRVSWLSSSSGEAEDRSLNEIRISIRIVPIQVIRYVPLAERAA